MKKMTHIGIVKGCDKRTDKDFKSKICFRETKLHWINTSGIKFSKKRGGMALGGFSMYYLDLETIKSI